MTRLKHNYWLFAALFIVLCNPQTNLAQVSILAKVLT